VNYLKAFNTLPPRFNPLTSFSVFFIPKYPNKKENLMTISLYASLLAIMLISLSINVVRARKKNKIALGYSKNNEMQRRVRAQGNFTEYTPLFLILLGLAEFGGLPTYGVHGFGILFLLGRISHAYGILKAEQYGGNGEPTSGFEYRICGMMCTFISLGLLAVLLLVNYL
jgi:uncharacterized membrane protein YecN with MAPEG domain